MALLNRIFDGLLDFCALLAAAILMATALGIGIEVALRATGLAVWAWITELTEYGMMAATFLGAPWVLREAAHVKVDFVVSMLKPVTRRIVDWMANLFGLAICIGVLVYGVHALLRSFRAGSIIYQQFFIPEWWTLTLLPFCFVLLTIEFLRRIGRLAKGRNPDIRDSGLGL